MSTFKKFAKSGVALTVAASLLAPVVANAAGFGDEIRPYMGVEVTKSNQRLEEKFGEKLYDKDPLGLNVFVGASSKLNETVALGLEGGFNFQKEQKKTDVELKAADFLPGETATAINADTKLNTKIDATHPYVGVTVDFYAAPQFSINALAGFSYSRVSARHVALADGKESKTDFAEFKESKFIPMLRLGASYFVNENFAIRANATWRNMSRFEKIANNSKDKSAANYKNNVLTFKDTIQFGLGVAYYL